MVFTLIIMWLMFKQRYRHYIQNLRVFAVLKSSFNFRYFTGWTLAYWAYPFTIATIEHLFTRNTSARYFS